jgi:hypothetical protein
MLNSAMYPISRSVTNGPAEKCLMVVSAAG